MSTIVSLPPEIIYNIGAHLSTAGNKNLRYVCRYISQAVEPLALSSLAFCLDAKVLFLYANKLRAYAARTTRAAAHIRKLAVVSGDRLSDLDQLRGERWRQQVVTDGQPVSIAPPEDYQQLLQTFCALLLSLNNVTTFDWYLDDGTPEHIIARLLSFLASAPIKKLIVVYDRPALVAESLLHFPRQLSVRELVFAEIFSLRTVKTRGDIVRLTDLPRCLTANCPNLETLSLQSVFYNATPQAARLHDFLDLPHDTNDTNFTGTTTNAPALQLKSLSVTCLRLHLDHATLHHLRSLQYLYIRFPLTTPVHGDPVSIVMNTLRTEKIHLRGLNLNTPNVGNEVIEYLLSYANEGIIQEITFGNKLERIYSDADIASVTATRFFAEVLPAVAGSLLSLHITTANPFDAWCFNPAYVDLIKLCTKLEDLCLSVVREAGSKAEEALKETRRYLPRLLSLEVHHIRSMGNIGENIW